MKINNLVSEDNQSSRLRALVNRSADLIKKTKNDDYILEVCQNHLQLRSLKNSKMRPVFVDFMDKQREFRRKFGGGKAQMIAKAVGIKKGVRPNIIDATAGFGSDAFVFASLGCRVHMFERSGVMGLLLEDGLERAHEDPEIGGWVKERISLEVINSCQGFSGMPFQPDAIYLDPMYPERNKSALVKKDMRILRGLVGEDTDVIILFEEALKHTKERVVVKRPIHADWINDQKPIMSFETKKNRFDLYLV